MFKLFMLITWGVFGSFNTISVGSSLPNFKKLFGLDRISTLLNKKGRFERVPLITVEDI